MAKIKGRTFNYTERVEKIIKDICPDLEGNLSGTQPKPACPTYRLKFIHPD